MCVGYISQAIFNDLYLSILNTKVEKRVVTITQMVVTVQWWHLLAYDIYDMKLPGLFPKSCFPRACHV